MPQLPSGRCFALYTERLDDVIDQAMRGVRTHELMAITETRHLFQFLNVAYFRPRRNGEMASDKLEFKDAPTDLIAYPSGHTLGSLILEEFDQWPHDDQNALFNFLLETRTQNYLLDLLEGVEQTKNIIRQDGCFLARIQALWWDTGYHPLQPDDENMIDMDYGR